jgi:hypothetical protein
LALLIPRSAAAGGVWLGVTMAFAVLTHQAVPSPGLRLYRLTAIPNPVNAAQIADSVRILANPKYQHALMQVTGRAFENGPLAMGSVLFSSSLVEYPAQKFAEVDGQLKGANNLS